MNDINQPKEKDILLSCRQLRSVSSAKLLSWKKVVMAINRN